MKSSSEKNATSCVTGNKRCTNRWSIRQFLHSSPLMNRRRNQGNMSTPKPPRSNGEYNDHRLGHSSRDSECGLPHPMNLHQAVSRNSIFTDSNKSADGPTASIECPLCFAEPSADEFFEVAKCGHRACLQCLKQYLRVEISESRVIITCHECTEPIHPNEIKTILDDPIVMDKYEDFMVRRVLAVDADTRYCPAPDCGFAVIASECASCPKLRCERPGCDSFFCYHCKAEWHPNQTCDAARAQRSPNNRSTSIAYSTDSQYKDDIKPCPRCEVLIVKMDDGSCNHMMCAVCGAEFCWLCMKEISDLHYLSPSGCTFWGKKPWSKKKKFFWQLGTLVGAPVGIALVAGITVPAMIIGIPVWIGRKIYTRYKNANKHRRNAAIVGGVLASVVISPILAGLAVGIGVPILLFYVYGVVPVSLCRSGGCGGASTTDNSDVINCNRVDRNSIEAVNRNIPNPSIGEASISLTSDSHILRQPDREFSSTLAHAESLAGYPSEVYIDSNSIQRYSITSLSAESFNTSFDETGASMRALAGSINYKANGSDFCGYRTNEDVASERHRFEDNLSYKAFQAEKVSIASSSSYRSKSKNVLRFDRLHDTISNESMYIEIIPTEEEPARKFISHTAFLRSQFFHSSVNEQKPITKSMEDKTIIEVSNETPDKLSSAVSSSHNATEL